MCVFVVVIVCIVCHRPVGSVFISSSKPPFIFVREIQAYITINNLKYKQYIILSLCALYSCMWFICWCEPDWSVEFGYKWLECAVSFFAYWFLYAYCVYVVYRVKCCRPVSLLSRLPFFIKLELSWVESWQCEASFGSLHTKKAVLTICKSLLFEGHRLVGGTVENLAG